jgi:hypothetical protein
MRMLSGWFSAALQIIVTFRFSGLLTPVSPMEKLNLKGGHKKTAKAVFLMSIRLAVFKTV